MSEAMSSSDIEDVLSSIRRLVTGDLRPRTADSDAAETDPAPTEEATTNAAGKLLLTPALRVVTPVENSPRPPIDGVLSVIGAHVAPPPAGFEAETGDVFNAATETVPPRPVAAMTAPPRPLADTFVFSSTREHGGGKAEPDAPAAPPVPPPMLSPRPQAEASGTDDDMDEDDILPDEVSPVVDLDEETLRELIRDVLREELQGQMGERITRNIRKLVRAELARAISFRNLG